MMVVVVVGGWIRRGKEGEGGEGYRHKSDHDNDDDDGKTTRSTRMKDLLNDPFVVVVVVFDSCPLAGAAADISRVLAERLLRTALLGPLRLRGPMPHRSDRQLGCWDVPNIPTSNYSSISIYIYIYIDIDMTLP
jgi:hypothetical protein